MHANLIEVLGRLDESRAALGEAVESIPEPLRRTRPAPDRWSVAEVLEHLAKVDRFFAARIGSAIEEARATGLGSEQTARDPLPGDVLARMVDRTDRRAARDEMMPDGLLDASAAWADLDRARDQLRAAVASADGLALGTVKAEHRFFGWLTAYQWIELTAAHEMRHAEQIRDIGSALRG